MMRRQRGKQAISQSYARVDPMWQWKMDGNASRIETGFELMI